MKSDLRELLKPTYMWIYEELRPFFDASRELLLFSEPLCKRIEAHEDVRQSDSSELQEFMLFSYFRSFSLSKAIWLSASAGQRVEAGILLRCQTEAWLKTRFVLREDATKVDESVRDFFKYSSFERLKLARIGLDIAKRHGTQEEFLLSQEKVKSLEAELAGIEKDSLWPAKSVEWIAQQAGCKSHYDTVYRWFSEDVHFSPDGIYTYTDARRRNWISKATTADMEHILTSNYDFHYQVLFALCDSLFVHPFKAMEHFSQVCTKLMELSLSFESTTVSSEDGGQ